MATQPPVPASPDQTPPTRNELFSSRAPEPTPSSPLPWVIAGGAVLLLILALVLFNHRKPAADLNALRPLDPYAQKLVFSAVQMSESTSLSGGKSTFIDGHVRNSGDRIVTSATVQVLFANDEALPPQVETLPLTLIRTREPYVDTQPISAAPIAPGDEREFRLIFENIGTNWNQQLPEIHLIGATLR